MKQKPKPPSAEFERAPMSYPDPKIVEEMRKRGIEPPNPRVTMGPRLHIDPKTGKVTLAKLDGNQTSQVRP
jgi:hypothetical protein